MSKTKHNITEEASNVPAPVVEAASTALQTQDLGLDGVDPSMFGMGSMTARDYLIPKVFCMQPMSKQVTAGKAKFGEFIESLNSGVLGDVDHPLEFVPFCIVKEWVIFEEKNGAFKFAKTEAITPATENWPLEETINGVKIRRDRAQNFYCVLPGVKAGEGVPYVLSFRRTSSRAGQKIATVMMENIDNGKYPMSTVMELFGQKTTNDKGTFVVMDVREKRPATREEMLACVKWAKRVSGGQTKIDNSDLENETAGRATVETNTTEF